MDTLDTDLHILVTHIQLILMAMAIVLEDRQDLGSPGPTMASQPTLTMVCPNQTMVSNSKTALLPPNPLTHHFNLHLQVDKVKIVIARPQGTCGAEPPLMTREIRELTAETLETKGTQETPGTPGNLETREPRGTRDQARDSKLHRDKKMNQEVRGVAVSARHPPRGEPVREKNRRLSRSSVPRRRPRRRPVRKRTAARKRRRSAVGERKRIEGEPV